VNNLYFNLNCLSNRFNQTIMCCFSTTDCEESCWDVQETKHPFPWGQHSWWGRKETEGLLCVQRPKHSNRDPHPSL